MNARQAGATRALAAAIALAVLGAGGCRIDPLASEGRPCSETVPCGPGTTCDKAQKLCVVSGTVSEGGVLDGKGSESHLDLLLAGDAGCPSPLTACNGACVNLKTNVNHCGDCNTPCSPEGDTCSSGTCTCGSAAKCTSGLSCSGASCKCQEGGACAGCCSGNSCIPIASEDSTKCGKSGAACKSCADSNDCTSEACTQGACVVTNLSGSKCDDGNSCTYTDLCTSGTCKGTSYSCADSYSCTTDTCDGNGGCSNTLQSGYCVISSTCYASGTVGSTCYTCVPSKSTSSWTLTASSGCVTTFAGSGSQGFTNGTGTAASFDYPGDVTVDSSGYLFVADRANNAIRMITSAGVVTTLAGTGTAGYINGAGSVAQFYYPSGVAVDSSGKVFVADTSNHRIRYISGGYVYLLAGTGTAGATDGSTSVAQFSSPYGIAVDNSGIIYVSENGNHSLRKISGSTVSTLTTSLTMPYGIAISLSGSIIVADGGAQQIKNVSTTGVVTVLAGTGTAGYQEGAVASALFYNPQDVDTDSSGKIYVADRSNHRIRVISSGTVSLVAGTGSGGFQDGPFSSAIFYFPYGVAVGSSGNLFVADFYSQRIRLLTM
jgi:sugar lactone lactonase YvrE